MIRLGGSPYANQTPQIESVWVANVMARAGTSAALVSIAAAAATCGLNGTPVPMSRSGLARSHVENGALKGDSTRTTSHEAQSFEIMRRRSGEQK